MNTICSVCAFGIVCNSSQNRGRFDSIDSLECKDCKKSLLMVLCCVTIDGWLKVQFRIVNTTNAITMLKFRCS